MLEPSSIRYFSSPSAFRTWLRRHHMSKTELWVGFHKKGTGVPSLTWPESVDQALCFGWIDGLRRTVDAERYTIRFTPRRQTSTWSAKNLARIKELIKDGLVEPAGREIYEKHSRGDAGYSLETAPSELPKEYLAKLKRKTRAWAYFEEQPPWYRKTATHWIMSAKKEETRQRRLDQLITESARGKLIPPLAWTKKGATKKTSKSVKAAKKSKKTAGTKRTKGTKKTSTGARSNARPASAKSKPRSN